MYEELSGCRERPHASCARASRPRRWLRRQPAQDTSYPLGHRSVPREHLFRKNNGDWTENNASR
jgi:hypothetical protein